LVLALALVTMNFWLTYCIGKIDKKSGCVDWAILVLVGFCGLFDGGRWDVKYGCIVERRFLR